ncbi:MAG: DUF1489 family protein [Hyphomonas sp.]
MTIHLVKLCVGVDSVDDLIASQLLQLERGDNPVHHTRMTPKRAEEILNGGSLYWVIRKAIRVRQKIVDIRQFRDGEGKGMCELVFSPDLVPTYAKPKRPFQGWRYLKPDNAPRDLNSGDKALDIPASLDEALKQAGVW